MEKELNVKTNKNEREKLNEELKSKLKAAETLCETLMDENEDMKKEIRELEEEIYEMQDNFRQDFFYYPLFNFYDLNHFICSLSSGIVVEV